MRTADLTSGLLCLALALFITLSGWDLGLGTMVEPGSGFMIFWVGVIMTVLSLAALAFAVREPAHRGLGALWTGLSWKKIPYVTILLVIYAWLLPTLGFPLTTVLFLLVLFKTVEPQSWGVSIGGAIAAMAVAYLVFNRWLGTQLPAGSLWSG